jgi:hypothetical protein
MKSYSKHAPLYPRLEDKMNDANELCKFNTDIYPRFEDKCFKCLKLTCHSDSIILESRIIVYFNRIQTHLKV